MIRLFFVSIFLFFLAYTAQAQKYSINSDVPDGFLNLRSGPGIGYDIAIQIPSGTTNVSVTDCKNSESFGTTSVWCSASWNGKSGWLAAKYISHSDRAEVVPPQPTRQAQITEPAGSPDLKTTRLFIAKILIGEEIDFYDPDSPANVGSGHIVRAEVAPEGKTYIVFENDKGVYKIQFSLTNIVYSQNVMANNLTCQSGSCIDMYKPDRSFAYLSQIGLFQVGDNWTNARRLSNSLQHLLTFFGGMPEKTPFD